MRALPWMLVLATGCTWISQADLQSKQLTADDDKDGFAAEKDCDDKDAAVYPDAEDPWYDGVDANCAGDDDFDADADGFVPAEHLGKPTAGVDTSGALPGGDCDDTSATTLPGADDAWYDGVDTDCDARDDHDADEDGQVPDAYLGIATANAPGTGSLPGGDCDDTAAAVYTGAPDTWRDGLDSDCGGEDDYDTDGDGYVRPEDAGLPTRYVDGSGALPATDCNDDDGAINPGSAEIWYDDVDNDCAPATDDDDQDADSFAIDAATAPDCDDTDAAIYPGAPEALGDTTDADCDGGVDTLVLGTLATEVADFADLRWTNPRDPRWSANSTDAYLSIPSEQVDVDRPAAGGGVTTTEFYDSALAFRVPLSAAADGVDGFVDWQRTAGADPAYTLTDGHDFVATEDAVYGAMGLQLPTGRALRLSGYNLDDGLRYGISYRLSPTSGAFADFKDVNLAVDEDGGLHAVGCEDGTSATLQYMRATPSRLATSSYDEAAFFSSTPMSTCEPWFVDATTLGVVGRGTGGLRLYALDATAESPTLLDEGSLRGSAGVDIEVVDTAEGTWVFLADPSAATFVFLAPDGEEISLAISPAPVKLHVVVDAATEGMGMPDFVLSWTDAAGDAHFALGRPDTGFDRYALPSSFTANEAAVYATPDGTHLLLSVIGGGEVGFGVLMR